MLTYSLEVLFHFLYLAFFLRHPLSMNLHLLKKWVFQCRWIDFLFLSSSLLRTNTQRTNRGLNESSSEPELPKSLKIGDHVKTQWSGSGSSQILTKNEPNFQTNVMLTYYLRITLVEKSQFFLLRCMNLAEDDSNCACLHRELYTH